MEQPGGDGRAWGGLGEQSHGKSCNLTRGLDGGTLLMKSCNQYAAVLFQMEENSTRPGRPIDRFSTIWQDFKRPHKNDPRRVV